MIRFLRKLRNISHVVRWNFLPRVRHENVAEHSFWVAIYALILSDLMDLSPNAMTSVAVAALLHDAEESVTGDLPSLVKRYVNWDPIVDKARDEMFKDGPHRVAALHLNSDDNLIVKAADLFAALAYAEEECKMGNQNFEAISGELVGSLFKMAEISDLQHGVAIKKLLWELGHRREHSALLPLEMSHS